MLDVELLEEEGALLLLLVDAPTRILLFEVVEELSSSSSSLSLPSLLDSAVPSVVGVSDAASGLGKDALLAATTSCSLYSLLVDVCSHRNVSCTFVSYSLEVKIKSGVKKFNTIVFSVKFCVR